MTSGRTLPPLNGSSRSRAIVIAHRGASGYRPEHTRAAYELAFHQGADAVEPDIVVSQDGVLVIRHENELSGTTDIASHPEFADRRTTKFVDGTEVTGWFIEDLSWVELQTLRARERRPEIRPHNAAFDGRYGLLTLSDLFEIAERVSERGGRLRYVVAELKHVAYFTSIGLPLEELYAQTLADTGWADGASLLATESVERAALAHVRNRGVGGARMYLLESNSGTSDAVRTGEDGIDLSITGLRRLASQVDGISIEKSMILGTEAVGANVPASTIVDDAHAAGLRVFCWTLRPENRYLSKRFVRGVAESVFGQWEAEFGMIFDSGVDGVFADHPDLAIAVRDRG